MATISDHIPIVLSYDDRDYGRRRRSLYKENALVQEGELYDVAKSGLKMASNLHLVGKIMKYVFDLNKILSVLG